MVIKRKSKVLTTNRSFSLLSAFVMGLVIVGNGSVGECASPRQLDTFSAPSAGGFNYNPPTLVDDYIYIGTSRHHLQDLGNDNYFFKLDSNLNKVWEYPLGSREVRGNATLDSNGNIYFVVEEGRTTSGTDYSNLRYYLYSLNNNGTFRWSKDINSSSGLYGSVMSTPAYGMYNPAIGADDRIYIGGRKFYGLDTNGSEKWSYSSDHSKSMDIRNSPIIDPAGNIYFVGMDTEGIIKVFSLTSDCKIRWTHSVPTVYDMEYFSSPAFSTDYSRIFAAIHDRLYCLAANTGSEIWQFKPEGMTGTFRATPSVDNQNNIYIGTHSDSVCYFYAIKADGTGLLWENAIGEDMYSSPALGNDNTVYVGSEFTSRGRFHALDMTTGNFKWSASLARDVTWSSPAIASDGTLYIATMSYEQSNGAVYSFDTDSTGLLSNAGSPRFHEGNASTGRKEDSGTEVWNNLPNKSMPWIPLLLDD